MRRLLLFIVTALVVATAATAGAVAAADVIRFTRIDISFAEQVLKEFLTEACGFPVYAEGEGYLDVTLQYNAEGRVVRETYTTPGGFVTFSAPTTGTSYRFPWQPREEFVYPGGATIGSLATYRLTGMIVNHPGVRPEAGLITLTGTVVDVTADGMPVVGFTADDFANAFVRGSLIRATDPTQSICAALATT